MLVRREQRSNNTMATEKLPVKKTPSIFDEIERANEQIMRRAYEIFTGNGNMLGRDLDNWLVAERELFWNPAIDLSEKDDRYFVNIALPGMDPKDLEIRVTSEHLLVKGETQHKHETGKEKVHTCEFHSGSVFRTVRFPRKINPDDVKAEFKNGILRVTAPVAQEKRARAAKIGAA
jgi:HSP20 family protein